MTTKIVKFISLLVSLSIIFTTARSTVLINPLLQKLADKILNKTEEANELIDEFNALLNFSLPDPWNIETIKPTLTFYQIGNKNFEVLYDFDPKKTVAHLNSIGFLHVQQLILITHGFHNNFDTDWLHDYKDVILNITASQKIPQTVAILGWGGGADILVFRYRQAAANVLTVGQWLAKFVIEIKKVQSNLRVYGIGHSLGAHVMGVAGRISKNFDRITGLDPAGPCFEKVENSETLRPSDAKFVDVIHTDGYDSRLDPSEWFFPVNHYGSLIPIGSVDFYPNYGYHQPGAGTFTVAGSHLRSLDLFLWSMTNRNRFVTDLILTKVPDFDDPVTENKPSSYRAEMGFFSDRWPIPPRNESNTLFYLKTNKNEPWV